MIHCRWPRAIGRMATRAALALVLATSLAALAVAVETFVVRDIEVDVTAATAAEARDQALAEGERKAFRLQLERLTSRADWPSLPNLTNEEIAPYVQDFEVTSEKASAVRYIATLNYSFKEQAVRRLLADRNTPFAMTRSKPVAVVPVYTDPGAAEAAVLWDDSNPWRAAWASRSSADGLVPLVLPDVDPSDAGVVTAEQAVQGDPTSLSAITRRAGAYTALVAHATRLDAGGGVPEVKVSLAQYGPGGREHASVKTYTGREGESVDELLARAAAAVALEMEQRWKDRSLVQVTGRSVTPVTLPVANLRQWQTVKERLERIPVVQHTELVVLSRDHARLNLFHMGTPEQLAVALRQVDLELSRQDVGMTAGGSMGGAPAGGGMAGAPPGGAMGGAGPGGAMDEAASRGAVEEKWILRLPSGGAVARP